MITWKNEISTLNFGCKAMLVWKADLIIHICPFIIFSAFCLLSSFYLFSSFLTRKCNDKYLRVYILYRTNDLLWLYNPPSIVDNLWGLDPDLVWTPIYMSGWLRYFQFIRSQTFKWPQICSKLNLCLGSDRSIQSSRWRDVSDICNWFSWCIFLHIETRLPPVTSW